MSNDNNSGTIVLDKPEQISAYRILTMRSALGLEVKCPGMKATRMNVFKIVKQEFGFKGTKESVLRQLENWMEDNGFDLTNRRVTKR